MEEIKEMLKSLMKAAVKNSKDEDKDDDGIEIDNEAVDKRKLIDEVAGIMKSAGCDDEDIRTAIGKMEKIGYDDSEKSADNKKAKNEKEEEEDEEEIKNKKVKNEDKEDEEKVEELKEETEEEVENKCKKVNNSKRDYFSEMSKVYNSAYKVEEKKEFKTREDRLKDGRRF